MIKYRSVRTKASGDWAGSTSSSTVGTPIATVRKNKLEFVGVELAPFQQFVPREFISQEELDRALEFEPGDCKACITVSTVGWKWVEQWNESLL